MIVARLSFIAHATTEAQRLVSFPLDEPIAERERAKFAQSSVNVPYAQKAWTGPELRTQDTARLLGLQAEVAEGLRDCGYGTWHGRRMEDVQSEDPGGFLAWLTVLDSAPHGGESIDSLISRVGRWIEEQTGGKHTLAVTHPAVIRAALVYTLHLPHHTFWRFDIAPVTLTDLRFSHDIWTLRCCGCSLLGTTQPEDRRG
jgi:broad specificity phosphatase PhoE